MGFTYTRAVHRIVDSSKCLHHIINHFFDTRVVGHVHAERGCAVERVSGDGLALESRSFRGALINIGKHHA